MDTCNVSVACKQVSRTGYDLDAKEVLQAVYALQRQFRFDGLLYGSALETNPGLLDAIPVEPIMGNSSQTLRQCADAKVFFTVLDKHAIPHPEVSFVPVQDQSDAWLLKRSFCTGGLGVTYRPWKSLLSPNTYYQKKINGLPFSLTLLANGDEIRPLGFNSLWTEMFNENLPYVYAGAINWADLSETQQASAMHYARTLTHELNLVGLNSVDFILFDQCVYVLEVNPRIPATYELYETRSGALMRAHIDASQSGKLATLQRKKLLRAHAIVYAHERMCIAENFKWPLWTADQAHAGKIINRHEPVCSIFAGGQNTAQVKEMITTRRKTILAKLQKNNKNCWQ